MVAICEHLHDTGRRCGSPATRDSQYCHFHQRAHNKPYFSSTKCRLVFDLGVLESAESIQIAITHASHALLNQDIDSKQANALFRGFALALRAITLKAKWAQPQQSPGSKETLEVEVNVQETQTADVCHAELSEASQPSSLHNERPDSSQPEMSDEERARAIYNSAFRSNHMSPEEARIEGYRRVLLIGPSSIRYEEAKRELAAFEEKQKKDQLTVAEPPTDHRPPEDFLDAPVAQPETFTLREDFYPADAIRRYWTQHLPEDLKTSRAYEPPEWLPLTREEFDYIRDHMGLSDPRTTEQRRFCERLIQHNSHRGVTPPKEDAIRAVHNELEVRDKKSLPELLFSTLRDLQSA